MSTTRKHETPPGLEVSGLEMWQKITASYDLRTDEAAILKAACHEADLIDLMQRGLKDAPLFMKGSMGQQVANPLFSELRQHRATLASLLGKLQLPDEVSGAKPRAVGARKAAAARWGSAGA